MTSSNARRRRVGPRRRTRAAVAVATGVIALVPWAVPADATPAVGSGSGPDGPTSVTITSPPPGPASVGTAYEHTFAASPPPSQWVVTGGDLPSGLTLDADTGTLSGTPAAPGTHAMTVSAGDPDPATTLSTGGAHTCAIRGDGAVVCWGSNTAGRLGLGDTAHRGDGPGEMGDALPTVDLGTGRTATAVSAGNSHTCAILDTGALKCWGDNTWGQLGLGDTATRGDGPGEMGDALPTVDLGTGRTATAVTAGWHHTCAILDTGAVRCWGFNASGQLGLGDTATRGDGPGEMGDALPTVDLGTGRTATAIDVGATHTCAILDTGDVKCWGANPQAQLGLGDVANRGDGPGEMGDALPVLDLPGDRSATSVALGLTHSCASFDDGTLTCWGDGELGQLGHPVGTLYAPGYTGLPYHGDMPGEMGEGLPLVNLGTGRTATAVRTQAASSCAHLDGGGVVCWGVNSSGQLGIGSRTSIGRYEEQMGDALALVGLGTGRTATAVDIGASHACAVLDDATVRCWGASGAGQLGLGDTVTRGDGPGEMGNALPTVDLPAPPSASQAFTLTVDGVATMTPKAGPDTGGTTVTLTGVGFSDVTGVRFGTTPATGFTVVDDTTITAVSPPRPAGLVNVWLDSPAGANVNLPVTHFNVWSTSPSAPSVHAVSPNVGDIGGGATVTITGTGFLTVTGIRFGQAPAASYTIVDDTHIVATTPPRTTPALVNVWVTNPDGTNPNQPSSWYDYRITTGPPPTVTSVSPITGATAGGELVTVTGTGFSSAIRVDFGSTAAPSFTVVDDTTITVTTPARPAGLVNVWVRTGNGANPNQPSSWYRYQ